MEFNVNNLNVDTVPWIIRKSESNVIAGKYSTQTTSSQHFGDQTTSLTTSTSILHSLLSHKCPLSIHCHPFNLEYNHVLFVDSF
ncbi:hypothetical protein FACS189472_16070 [Alphaproteobacteria bacterium]|nr:hypothetical protein FACS189472_16070 [Alphaproteobacteria bacterium]